MKRLIGFVTLALALASARGSFAAVCDASGLMVNGFEGAASGCTYANDNPNWSGTPSLVAVLSGGATHSNPEGDYYARLQWSGLNQITHTLLGGSIPVAVGTDWSSQKFAGVAYATTVSAAVNFSTSIILNTAASGAVWFQAASTNVTRTGSSVPLTGWAYAILSIDYAKNLGVDLTSISDVSLQQDAVAPGSGVIAYDHFRVYGATATPNNPVPDTQITSVGGCNAVTVSWTAQAQTGSEPIFGYHIYRSTGATGPWQSLAYVTSGNSYPDNVTFAASCYYVVLPYSSSTNSFGPSANEGYYLGCATAAFDPIWLPGYGGVHEAPISAATPKQLSTNSGCTPTPSFTSTPSPSMTFTRTPTPTASPTFTDTSTTTPTPTITDTSQPTNTPGGPTNTPIAGASATSTFTISPTFTASPTITPTFTNTLVPTPRPDSGALIYPNPFNPDKGEVFHLGNVPAGEEMRIYNMIGELVFNMKLKGDRTVDVWDGLNNNGVKVVTGVYFLYITGSNQVYRVAVVRQER